MTAHGDGVQRWADSLAVRPHIPKYLTSPGGAQYLGTAAVAIALTTRDIKIHTAAVKAAARIHREHTARRKQHTAHAEALQAYLDTELGPWLDSARQEEARLTEALRAHDQAAAQWREAAGRLLAAVRNVGVADAEARVVGLDTRYPPAPRIRRPEPTVTGGR